MSTPADTTGYRWSEQMDPYIRETRGSAFARVGDQTRGRVFCILQTDDFWRDHKALAGRGVAFTETPREESYGTVAVFKDLYGNLWDLLQTTP